MGEHKEATTPVSFRLTPDTREKIQKIAQEIGLNQQGTMEKLIEAYELQNGKQQVTDPGMQELIKGFEYHTSEINIAFIGMIHSFQEAKAKAELQVKDQLDMKDELLLEIREKLKVTVDEKAEAEDRQKAAEEELKKLKEELSSLHEEHDQAIADYEEKLEERNKTINQAEKMQQLLQQEVDRLEEGASVVNAQKDEIAKLKADLETKEELLKASQKERANDDLQHKRVLMDLEEKYRKEKQTAIDEYQEKYKNLLEKLEKMQSKEPTSPR